MELTNNLIEQLMKDVKFKEMEDKINLVGIDIKKGGEDFLLR